MGKTLFGTRQVVNIVGAAAMAVTLSACHTATHRTPHSSNPSYAGTIPFLVLGLAIAAGVAFGGVSGYSHHGHHVSDATLKTDIKPLKLLDNGVQVYTYRYKGDDRVFSGVLAQDLLKDRRFAHAVKRGEHGFLMVDYAALGLKLFEADQLQKAGEAAVARAG